jgi:hypothetical protein
MKLGKTLCSLIIGLLPITASAQTINDSNIHSIYDYQVKGVPQSELYTALALGLGIPALAGIHLYLRNRKKQALIERDK